MSTISDFWARVSNFNFQLIGGRAVDASNPPTYTENDQISPSIDKDNGGLIVNPTALSSGVDSITAVESLASLVKTLTALTITAGSRQNFESYVPSKYVIVYARTTNSGTIWVGGSDVTNGGGAKPGIPLDPGGREILHVANANLIYVDVTTSNDIAYAIAI